MTEKRFISATYDNRSWLRLYLGENEYESYRPSELLDLLNGLVDENEQLKEIKERYDETIVDWNALKSEYDDLKNENEELKQENKILENDLKFGNFLDCITDMSDITALKKENEQLKEEVLNLKVEIGRLNHKKEIKEPHWLKYEHNDGYTTKSNVDRRFLND